MTIGANSPFWRKLILNRFGNVYFRRKIRTQDGAATVYVSPGSSLKVLKPRIEIEAPHQRFIRDWVTVDAVVWDIGANLGLFAFPAAMKARRGQVYAFEPDAELAENLIRSCRAPANSELRVSPVCVAVFDADTMAVFEISRFSRAMSKLQTAGQWHQDQISVLERRHVPTLRVDTLVKTLSPPAAMKIDVEGAEMRVLEGASATIAAHRPPILIEGPRELWDGMKRFFDARDYVLFDGSTDAYIPLAEPVWDTFAIPRERISGAR